MAGAPQGLRRPTAGALPVTSSMWPPKYLLPSIPTPKYVVSRTGGIEVPIILNSHAGSILFFVRRINGFFGGQVEARIPEPPGNPIHGRGQLSP